MSENQAQIESWTGRVGNNWARYQATLDRAMGPLGKLAIDAAHVAPRERVLDVGCGCGDSTLVLAALCGPGGQVMGVDVSEPMLSRARARVAERPSGGAPVELALADASIAPLPSDRDLVFSRFGVMFFADPTRAFSHLRESLHDRGRLSFVCWRPPAENAWVHELVGAVAPHLPPAPATDPFAPGPFAFADRDRTTSMLSAAGFKKIAVERHDVRIAYTQSPSLEDALDFFTHIGPAARRIADADEHLRPAAYAALSDMLAKHLTPSGVSLDGSVWVVTANAR